MRPPRVAERLLRMVAADRDRRYLLADLTEEFERLAATAGRPAATRWYWRQVITSLRPLLAQRTARALRVRLKPDATGTSLYLRTSPIAIASDLGQSWRWIRRHPGLALTVVTTLTVAFAAVLAAFAVINAVVLRPLPFPSPDRIVEVRVTGPTVARGIRASSRPNFEDWRERTRSFAALAAYGYPAAPLRLSDRGEPRELDAVRVTEDWSRVLGLQPGLGRLFTGSDFGEGAAPVVVLTHAFWRSEFAADPAAIGRTLTLNGRPHEIVGVLPDVDVSFPADRHAIWLPLNPAPGAFWEHARETGWLFVLGRLRDDVSRAHAEQELTSVARALAVEHPRSNRDRTDAELTPISDALLGPITPVLVMIAIAITAVLLIACGNVANLLLASAAARAREFAVRAAIGAPRTRVVSQIAGEVLVLCGTAGVAAIALCPGLVRAFISLYPTALPRRVAPGIDTMTAAAACGLVALATVMLAVPQTLYAMRVHVTGTIAAGARATQTRADRAMRAALVTVQIALSFVLVVAGVGFVRTFNHLVQVDTGYRSKDVMTFTVTPSPSSGSAVAALQFYQAVIDSVRQIPGVRTAAAAVAAPMATGGWSFGLRPRGASTDVLVGVNLTTPEYFEALGIPLREGRQLTSDEQRTGNAVAVVNEPLAKMLGDHVVGSRFNYSGRSWEIVGVVGGIRHSSIRDEPVPELFIPWHMAGQRPQTIVVRADGDPLRLIPAITARVKAIDPTTPVSDVARLDDRLGEAVVAERFRAALLACLAAIAVALAGLGAYSVTACSVAKRTREYGIRLALGERPASIGRRALSAAVGPALLGVLAGSSIALASGKWLESFLYGVSGRDGTTIAATTVALVGLAVVAAATAARRAANLNPVTTLAQE